MIRLILADLIAGARIWAGTLAVAAAAGFVGALAAGLIETGAQYGGRVQEGLSSTSAAVMMFSTITALITLNAAAGLTVSLQQRSYALWQLVGMPPLRVTAVVLAQLTIVGAAGGMIGGLLALPAFGPLFRFVFRTWEGMDAVAPSLSVGTIALVAAAVALIVLIGGLRGARRAGRVAPIEALRESEPAAGRMGWLRLVVLLGVLWGTVALALQLTDDDSLSTFSGKAVLLTPLIAACFAAAGPLLYPLMLTAWTAILPPRVSTSWYLARHTARHRLGRSTAAIGPLMIAIALTGGLYTLTGTLAEKTASLGGSARADLEPEAVVLLLGGPLLLSAVAGAATVFMSGQARERELALVQAAGATHGTILRTAIGEAVVYAVTAALLGLLATVLGGVILAATLGIPSPALSLGPLALIAGGGLVLLLLATTVPVLFSLRRSVPRTLAAAG